jgi:hypothetical protein
VPDGECFWENQFLLCEGVAVTFHKGLHGWGFSCMLNPLVFGIRDSRFGKREYASKEERKN